MIIESMTATFGKLQTETLTLDPGLNLLQMPNETGKSTWCAFLLAMLYGVDTSERKTRTNLPAKEHYAPWSGSAMEGRLRVVHEGRRITIERSSTARAPLSVFRAFDTDSGQPIEELTSQNCGQNLLGVPRQVFERSAFLRQDGAAIQMDATLEQRLNALVTTGDETISFQEAERTLRERRNRCRHNKTGLIPQTRAHLDNVNERLSRLDDLHEALAEARQTEQRLRAERSTARMQLSALQARELSERRAQLQQVGEDAKKRAEKAEALEAACADLPPVDELERWERELSSLESDRHTLALDLASLPPAEAPPAVPEPLAGLDDIQIQQKTNVDGARIRLLRAERRPLPVQTLLLALLFGTLAAVLFINHKTTLGFIAAGLTATVILAGLGIWLHARNRWLENQAELRRIERSYGVEGTDELEDLSVRCRERYSRWQQADAERTAELDEMHARQERLDADSERLLSAIGEAMDQPCSMAEAPALLRRTIDRLVECENTRRGADQALRHYRSLRDALGDLPAPGGQDVSVPEGKTIASVQTELLSIDNDLRQIRTVIDRCEGQRSTLGDRMELDAQQQQLTARLDSLEEEYDALEIALTALGKANEHLQSRFSPQLTELAADYLSRLTDGAYTTLVLEHDLGASLYAPNNPASRDAAYFSGGTKDQLYLAVRLAVSQMLCPGTPLILDDALVRFDDSRLKAALQVLQQEAESRQVLLFTCQSRESDVLGSL